MRLIVATLAAVLTTSVLVASAPVASAGGVSPRLDRAERGLIRAINHRRAVAGLRTVRASRRLNRAADYHSSEMAYGNYFSHASRDGRPMELRVRSFTRSSAVGETLAVLGGGCRRHIGARVVRMWMASGSHRAVLMSAGFRRVGVARRGGTLSGRRACMVTADFASRR
jgi:uncharacterized protein YkwD